MSTVLMERRSAHAMDWSGLITRRTSAGGFPVRPYMSTRHD